MKSIPIARGVILCDAVRVEPGTGKMTLVNCFDLLTAPAFPCAGRAFSLVSFLSDGLGELRMRVEVEMLEGADIIYVRHHRLSIPDRLLTVVYRFEATGCVFPHPGPCAVTLYADSEPIGSVRVQVTEKEDPR